MTRVRAVAGHVTSGVPPIRITSGDTATVTDQTAEHWRAFVHIRTSAGGSGWVPARYVSSDSPGPTTVLVEYETTELATQAGDELEVVARDDESAWHWCRNVDGAEGWVPVETLEPLG